MRIVIAGGSGFIGQKLTDTLVQEGHEIVILSRKKKNSSGQISYIQWLEKGTAPEKEIKLADAFINLAGVSINAGRWNSAHRKQIYHSRMKATDEIIRIISALPKKPSVYINASAIGIYPPSLTSVYTEDTFEPANDFLGKTVYDWEAKAKQVESLEIRAVLMRFGVVLGKKEGALPLMVLPYRLFAGGTVGSGEQWVSWVHVADVVRSIAFVIKNDRIFGPVNVTAPSPVKMKEFGRTIGSILHRPHWLPVPSIAMKLLLGQKSKLVLEGQHVIPKVLLEEGFNFNFSSLDSALVDLLKIQ
ncbi:multidrug MFS transporter [Bacillus sp. SA1-12]|uniref:TIGR01777 family oxidoreductase n=1 Tax=Bacillus sp. SA1-12 TaxID=1455638 RepID=UPI0006270FF0|nr:TIGR01777 family oxidoreductase [Bacillus sp. SA1-12]KKI90456.1 multidrug MFS transporter [Bacillus sp. SA1-12]